MRRLLRRAAAFPLFALAACGSASDAGTQGAMDAGATSGDGSSVPAPDAAGADASGSGGGGGSDGSPSSGTSPSIAGCPILPANHIFNTPIDGLPVHASSAAFLATIGNHNLHLDLGTTVDSTSSTYYGIPYNVVHGSSMTWAAASYTSADTSLSWDPRPESDCATGAAHTLVSPCTASAAPQPAFPIPANPSVEGGIDTDPSQPYGDHHILLLDADSCRLWELYHSYPGSGGSWDIFGSASFDLRSNALRPAGWTSADAAGFPMLPLLLRADEASSGAIRHALRFTITSSKIRNSYVWPARHLTSNGTSSGNLPPMGQLFRLKASYAIPSTFNTQSHAILQAMKTYGMYIADGGSDMYVTGEPNATWADDTFSQVQSVSSGQFEAVDLSSIAARPGFDPDSAAVP
jgi:hypothetical protein